MPTKKKKRYNARFPPARIKKIMQSDEEVGKVAAAVPVIISRALELFVDTLLDHVNKTLELRGARTMTPGHLKMCIHSEPRFDFLKALVADVSDLQGDLDEREAMTETLNTTAATISTSGDGEGQQAPPARLQRQLSASRIRSRNNRKHSLEANKPKFSSSQRYVDVGSEEEDEIESQTMGFEDDNEEEDSNGLEKFNSSNLRPNGADYQPRVPCHKNMERSNSLSYDGSGLGSSEGLASVQRSLSYHPQPPQFTISIPSSLTAVGSPNAHLSATLSPAMATGAHYSARNGDVKKACDQEIIISPVAATSTAASTLTSGSLDNNLEVDEDYDA